MSARLRLPSPQQGPSAFPISNYFFLVHLRKTECVCDGTTLVPGGASQSARGSQLGIELYLGRSASSLFSLGEQQICWPASGSANPPPCQSPPVLSGDGEHRSSRSGASPASWLVSASSKERGESEIERRLDQVLTLTAEFSLSLACFLNMQFDPHFRQVCIYSTYSLNVVGR